MSSLAGLQGTPPITMYAATKAFGAVLADGLWAELRGSGVDVVACVAGAVETPSLVESKLEAGARNAARRRGRRGGVGRAGAWPADDPGNRGPDVGRADVADPAPPQRHRDRQPGLGRPSPPLVSLVFTFAWIPTPHEWISTPHEWISTTSSSGSRADAGD